MANTQSKIDLLEELNFKLQAENSELRNENAKSREIKKRPTLLLKLNRVIKKNGLIAKLEYDVLLIKEQSLQDKDMVLINEEVPVSSKINSINNHKQIVSQSENTLTSDIRIR
ncbi:11595_t:CDS:2 [Cetraspora pellucida]|uniref:11595_t:CDS:1 n=1 Tax=Cetraspora pellucida TaxID=1433469 RepID=A0ACA9N4R3_9GLOM|nr:11595_t:CDS:2 [Cetraspora pellucida]